MKRVVFAVVCAFGLVLTAVVAQDPEPMKPGPEHERLGYFVGEWKASGTMAETPFGPAGSFTSEDKCDWFEGKFAVVCTSEGTGPMGPSKNLGILSYSPEEKVYTYYGIESTGMTMTSVSRGTVDGKTWHYTDESKIGDKIIKSRWVMEELSQSAYTFKWDTLGEDGSWTTVGEGKVTRK